MYFKKLLITLSIILLGSFSNLLAEDYSVITIGYTKNISKSPHDSGGSTYHKDPEDNGQSIGFAFGSRSGETMFETEVFYNTLTTHKLTDDVKADVSTLALMTNAFFAPNIGNSSNSYGLIGAGFGLGNTKVNSKYSDGADPGEKTQWTFGYQYMIGFGIDNIEIIYKHTDLGEVKSGSTSSYNADEFDNISKTINIRYNF
jgi:opacity protein-like surface antigen